MFCVCQRNWFRRDREGFDRIPVAEGRPELDHSHADAGTFVLYHAGEPLVFDSGTSSYVIPEWHTYYHTTKAHSTIMVGGQGQGKRLAGKISGYGGVSGCGLIVADATAPYEGLLRRFIRRVCFLGQRYYCIVDELIKNAPLPDSGEPVPSGKPGSRGAHAPAPPEPPEAQPRGPFEWLLHYDGHLTEQSDGVFLIKKGDARLLVQMMEPGTVRWSIEQGFRATHEDFSLGQTPEEKRASLERADYLKVSPVEDGERQVFCAVLYPLVEGEAVPEFSPVREGNWVGIQVRRGGETDLVALRGPGSRRLGPRGIETDAKMLALTVGEEGTVQRCVIDRGSLLRVEGAVISVNPAGGTVSIGDAV